MGEAATLLVVEDNAHDVFLLKRAFIKAGINVPMHIVNDGQEAVDYLTGQEPYANRKEYPLPTLLLLDLKMPRLSGFDVIRWVREHKGLRRLPILVLSSSGLGWAETSPSTPPARRAPTRRTPPSAGGRLRFMLSSLFH